MYIVNWSSVCGGIKLEPERAPGEHSCGTAVDVSSCYNGLVDLSLLVSTTRYLREAIQRGRVCSAWQFQGLPCRGRHVVVESSSFPHWPGSTVTNRELPQRQLSPNTHLVWRLLSWGSTCRSLLHLPQCCQIRTPSRDQLCWLVRVLRVHSVFVRVLLPWRDTVTTATLKGKH